jgi:hypothetical protein
MRTKVFSIMQGWTPAKNVGEFKTALAEVEAKMGRRSSLRLKTLSMAPRACQYQSQT